MYVPADVFARYQRLRGYDVLMVSGTDAHGTPVTVRADQEGTTPAEVAARYHAEFLTYWRDLGISYDLYTTTTTDNHREVVQDEFMMLLDKGCCTRTSSTGFFDHDRAQRFLPDTYIEGECPHCHYAARTRQPVRELRPPARARRPDQTPLAAQSDCAARAARDRALLPRPAQARKSRCSTGRSR